MAILELTLDTGRVIRAHRLHMKNTYSGLLLGSPNAATNDLLLADLPRKAAHLFGDWPMHIVEPTRTAKEPVHPKYGPVESLPDCWIAADFTSSPCSDLMHASGLIVIWFQEAPFPVPSDAALKQLRGIAWESVARDFEY